MGVLDSLDISVEYKWGGSMDFGSFCVLWKIFVFLVVEKERFRIV